MRIVIDMQGAQTESRFRGIGRYTMSFVQAVARCKGEHEIYLVLNGLFEQTIEPIRAAFDGLLPQDHIRVWYAPGPVSAMGARHERLRHAAELIRESFLAQLKPDIIHITSLFEGYVDDAVVSLRKWDMQSRISATLYDLIPHLNPKQYLDPHPDYRRFYLEKMTQLRLLDAGLAISKYARQEALEHLPELTDKVFNVSSAVDAKFQPYIPEPAQSQALLKKIGIQRAFVLYTGGADERKNLPKLIEAYAALSPALRQKNQLLFAGKIPEITVTHLQSLARNLGMQSDEIRFTGYVSDDELIQLYNQCALFVFPSWQEGFGLPALEAMSCGAVVIGANTSSLPEVIGHESAMFDPFSVVSITAKMQQALDDEDFRASLRENGIRQSQKFSWDSVAQRALTVWSQLMATKSVQSQQRAGTGDKLRLALVSPLPPERTGIADYCAELLPALAEHYDIELVVAQERVDIEETGVALPVRDAAWFLEHAKHYDRVLYQFGNSPFHAHMLKLLQEIPGTVVLHDFFLSGLMSWLEHHGGHTKAWKQALLEDHGYLALQASVQNPQTAKLAYPVNGHVLRHATGLIVHSNHARQLIEDLYGPGIASHVQVVPLLRAPPKAISHNKVRQDLGLADDDFIVCSFGFLDASKLNHCLLQAWLESPLSKDTRCKLIFVGQNEGGEYGDALVRTIEKSGLSQQIRITGYASRQTYQHYLATADLAVQLRTHSRGETSAAALDVLNHGIATIVNAHGSMAEIDKEKVWMLADRFEISELVQALEALWQDTQKRKNLATAGRDYSRQRHSPQACAQAYRQALESHAKTRGLHLPNLLQTMAAKLPEQTTDTELKTLAQSLALDFPAKRTARRIYLDITATRANDRKTGIERVTRSLVLALMQNIPRAWLAEPVYLANDGGSWRYRHAHQYMLDLLECTGLALQEDVVEPQQGDILLILDLSGASFIQAQQSGLHDRYRQRGVQVHAVVYDLLPVRMPEVFPPGADQGHAQWLQAVSRLDGAVAISKAVQDDLLQWQSGQSIQPNRRPFRAGWFHLGADLAASVPTKGLPETAPELLARLAARPTFLMVGTIEPRKAHMQVLEAFTQLWAQGQDIHLVIVGREGWRELDDTQRRDIPQVMARLQHHPENQKHLHWLDGISDEYLAKIYAESACLLAASWGEGFGLPLIEAAHHQLPVLARDIPVFREVAGAHASYFQAHDAQALAAAVLDWLSLHAKGQVPNPQGMPHLTWTQSAQQLMTVVLDAKTPS